MPHYRVLITVAAACASILSGCATLPSHTSTEELRKQVADTERAFAKTMADRDFTAFASFISEEAVFISEPTSSIGKKQVIERWKRLYEKPEAPFSWEPAEVQVLSSGNLALSTGPVYDPKGKLIAKYTSIWRRDAANTWHIIFDRGNDVCDEPKN